MRRRDAPARRPKFRRNRNPVTWLLRHAQMSLASLGRLTRSPVSTLMTAMVIGIALALPSGLHLLVDNVRDLRVGLQSASRQVDVLAKTGAPVFLTDRREKALETILAVQGMLTGTLPPTINYTPDPEMALDIVTGEPRTVQQEFVLKNSFGFGGQNVTLCLKRDAA